MRALLAVALFACGPAHADVSRATEAARQAAGSDPACSGLGDFYWEIGDARQSLSSGVQGRGTVTASTTLPIASASKWIFGAYVLQKKGIDAVRADPSLRDGLRFTSGYTDFRQMRCIGQRTVGGCYLAGFQGQAKPNARTAGHFFYGGGHDQKLAAVDMGLSDMDADQLMQEIRATLALDAGFTMAPRDVLLAGAMRSSADAYASFLRRMMRRELVIGAHLGEEKVCAQPALCPAQADSSPIDGLNEPWSYSYNHWVEARQADRVDAYSSAGAFGFYPWVSADGRYYGVLSRHDRSRRAGVDSARCGRAIREAWLDATNSR